MSVIRTHLQVFSFLRALEAFIVIFCLRRQLNFVGDGKRSGRKRIATDVQESLV